MDGTTFDISTAKGDPVKFWAAAREAGLLGSGVYQRSGFIHIDLGSARQWGARFPVQKAAFAADTPPASEILADSRTLKSTGVASRAEQARVADELALLPDRPAIAERLSAYAVLREQIHACNDPPTVTARL